MDQDIKGRWVEALRSGRYPMADDGLKTSKGYTALGVLADLYCKDNGGKWFPLIMRSEETLYGIFKATPNEDRNILLCDGRSLSSHIREWAGLATNTVFIKGYRLTLWENSGEVNFPKLADLIEKEITL